MNYFFKSLNVESFKCWFWKSWTSTYIDTYNLDLYFMLEILVRVSTHLFRLIEWLFINVTIQFQYQDFKSSVPFFKEWKYTIYCINIRFIKCKMKSKILHRKKIFKLLIIFYIICACTNECWNNQDIKKTKKEQHFIVLSI